MANNPFLELVQKSNDLWNEYKGLPYSRESNQPRHVAKLKKLVTEIKEIDFTSEFEFLDEVYKPKKRK